MPAKIGGRRRKWTWFQPMCGTLYSARHVEPHDFARHNAQSFVLAVLVALVEQQLQAQADAEKRLARLDRRADRLDQLRVAQRGDRIAKRADAGQHDLCRHPPARPGRSVIVAAWPTRSNAFCTLRRLPIS